MKIVACAVTLAALAIMTFGATAWAGYDPDPIGYVQETTGDVVAINTTTKVKRWNNQALCRTMGRGGPVFQGDMIISGVAARAQILFLDGSILVVGEQSEIALDEFNYDFENNDANALSFDMGPGVFRYVSGAIVEKNADEFEMDTPLGLIGIRGTETLSVNHSTDNRNGEIAATLAPLFQDPANLPFEERQSYTPMLEDFAVYTSADDNGVDTETHAHVQGSESTPVHYTFDATGQSTDILLGNELGVSRTDGPGQQRPISNVTLDAGASSRKNPNAEVPTPLQGTLGDSSAGGGNSGSSSSESGGHP